MGITCHGQVGGRRPQPAFLNNFSDLRCRPQPLKHIRRTCELVGPRKKDKRPANESAQRPFSTRGRSTYAPGRRGIGGGRLSLMAAIWECIEAVMIEFWIARSRSASSLLIFGG